MKYRTEAYTGDRKWLLTDDGKKLFLQAGATYFHKTADDYSIAYEAIEGIDVHTEEEFIEKQKSVIGRAVVGGVLFGPLGTVVGGMSGIGTKQKKERKDIATVTYSGGQLHFALDPKDGSTLIKARVAKHLKKRG